MEYIRIHDFELLISPRLDGIDPVIAQAALKTLWDKLIDIKPGWFGSTQEIITSLGSAYGMIPVEGNRALHSRRAFLELGKWPEERRFDCVVIGLLWNMREVAHILLVRPAKNAQNYN